MKRLATALVLLLLASCPRAAPSGGGALAPGLEAAAIARGLVRDPRDFEMIGLYARDTDRVCVVAAGDGYRMGAYVDYGDGINCSGAGSVARSGTALRVQFGDGCAFDARFDGDRIIFPGQMPEGCARLCHRRASFAALSAVRLSEAPAEAAAMRDARRELLCAS